MEDAVGVDMSTSDDADMLIEDEAVVLIADKEDIHVLFADDADMMGKASDNPPIAVVDISFIIG